jgi:hypothetical protein
MQEGRDFWWDEEAEKVQSYCPCEPVNSEDPLFILYVSLSFLSSLVSSSLSPKFPSWDITIDSLSDDLRGLGHSPFPQPPPYGVGVLLPLTTFGGSLICLDLRIHW